MQVLPACLGTFRTLRSFRYRFGPGSFLEQSICTEYPPVSARRRGANRLLKRSPMRLISLTNPTHWKTAGGFRRFRYFRRSMSMPGKCANDGTGCDPPSGTEGRMNSSEVKIK
jgi:hypothetical protein